MSPAASYNLAVLVYASPAVSRNALTEEKYSALADAFQQNGFIVQSVSYHDSLADDLSLSLQKFDAVLVWVNPVEQGSNRKRLDQLLIEISGNGCLVSAHPEVILKMGTKAVLYETRDMPWGADVKMYNNYKEFTGQFSESLKATGIRVLKQYRGNGGNGVFKIEWKKDKVQVTHAAKGNDSRLLSYENFLAAFRDYFSDNGSLIDQPWNDGIVNGMVRCYVSGNKVAGFGYQEINALYPSVSGYAEPGKRYYFTEDCGLFSDLKMLMQSEWIPALQSRLSITDDRMPVIWDADFFINGINLPASNKYSLCEINVSCVSPFPPSAVKFMVHETRKRLTQHFQDK